MGDPTQAMKDLMQSVETAEKLRTKSNAELADLLREHVSADMPMVSPQYDLVCEVADRLRGLRTCATCNGWGYVAHDRCEKRHGTGDVDNG